MPAAHSFQLSSLGLDWILKHLTEQQAAPREVLQCDHLSLYSLLIRNKFTIVCKPQLPFFLYIKYSEAIRDTGAAALGGMISTYPSPLSKRRGGPGRNKADLTLNVYQITRHQLEGSRSRTGATIAAA